MLNGSRGIQVSFHFRRNGVPAPTEDDAQRSEIKQR